MAHHNDQVLNQTGQNLIRIVIGSYFMALSLDFVSGMNQSALFAPFMSFELADLVGSTALLVLSLGFMVGKHLRLTSLLLALFVFCTSLVQNFVQFEVANLSHFWRDLAMVGAIMLTYCSLRNIDLPAAAISRRIVQPRRIVSSNSDRRQLQREISTALSDGLVPRLTPPKPAKTPRPVQTRPQRPVMTAESDNIFAEI